MKATSHLRENWLFWSDNAPHFGDTLSLDVTTRLAASSHRVFGYAIGPVQGSDIGDYDEKRSNDWYCRARARGMLK